VPWTYLEELLTPERGMGLDAVLRSCDLPPRGILNGVDYEEFNPATDPYLPARYDLGDMAGKRENKAALQRRSGLPVDPDAVVVGMVTRLVDQKGVDLVLGSLQGIADLRVQVAVMGVGDEVHRAGIEAAARGSDRVAYHATSDEGLARLVYAGSDLFLAPSRFEPCGLGPLIAMRYGAVPVVRRTGGLAETVTDYRRDPDHGVGFTFVRTYSDTLTRRIAEAASVYRDTEAWAALRGRGMARRFSWADAAAAYDQLYLDAVEQRRERTSLAAVR
jgi:ADP-glucose type glycogen/starch synthase